MSLISGSYSRLLATGGAALLRDDMVEKGAATAVLVVIGVEAVARRAIGLSALQLTAERCRREREAALHRLRLMADMIELASAVPGRPQCSSERRKQVSYACFEALSALERIKQGEAAPELSACAGRSDGLNVQPRCSSAKDIRLVTRSGAHLQHCGRTDPGLEALEAVSARLDAFE